MRHQSNARKSFLWTGALRRGVEYAAAIGLALLSSYWIVQGRW
jgi:hypothetical protein